MDDRKGKMWQMSEEIFKQLCSISLFFIIQDVDYLPFQVYIPHVLVHSSERANLLNLERQNYGTMGRTTSNVEEGQVYLCEEAVVGQSTSEMIEDHRFPS